MNSSNEPVCRWDGITIFELDQKEYGIEIKNLHAVIRPEILELKYGDNPGVFQSVKFENAEIPIIDIYKIMGLKNKPKTSKARIIIVDPNDLIFGFEVDNVVEMLTFNPGKGLTGITLFTNCGPPFLAGKLALGSREILLPDIEKMALNILTISGKSF
jgi:chemotaxis signal transduction protein